MTYMRPQCTRCKHFIHGERSKGIQSKCKAFEEIPREIFFNEFHHSKPYEGDNGIQYEPIEEKK